MTSPARPNFAGRLRTLLGAGASALLAVGLLGPVAHAGGPSETGLITIVKYICESLNDPTTCTESRDDTLAGYNIDFLVHPGMTNAAAAVQTITVEIGENAAEEGNLGSGSEGRESGATELPLGFYTVCDQAVAYRADAANVPLDVSPRPEDTSGGANQTGSGDCIIVDLRPGNNVLKFVNARQQAAPTIAPAGDIGGPCADPAYYGIFDNTASTIALKFRFQWYTRSGRQTVKKIVPAGAIFRTWEHWVKPFTTIRVQYKDPNTGTWVTLATEQSVKGRYPRCEYRRGYEYPE